MKKFSNTKLLFLGLALFAYSCSSTQENRPENELRNDPLLFGISFPPVSNDEQRSFAKPLLAELNVDRIRFAEEWKFREPIQGDYNWGPLDDRIDWASANGLKILLTIQSNGPNWACSNQENANSCVFAEEDAFKSYISSLLQRYSNKIEKIQFGNEWQTDFWYIGTAEEFIRANNIVYNAIQEHSPETTVVLGGFTSISLRFLAGCNGLIDSFYNDEGELINRTVLDESCSNSATQDVLQRINTVLDNAFYDEVDMHLYDDVENWPIYIENFKQMVDKPIIVSEFGGPNLNVEPDNEVYQAERLQNYIKTLQADDEIQEAYFFKLIEGGNNAVHSKSGLIRASDLGKKLSFETFKRLTN